MQRKPADLHTNEGLTCFQEEYFKKDLSHTHTPVPPSSTGNEITPDFYHGFREAINQECCFSLCVMLP